MKRYQVNDGVHFNKYGYGIGCNHLANGVTIGGFISSYSDSLDKIDDNVCIENGIGEIRYALIGDISEAYSILKEIIEKRKPIDFNEICECVFETVYTYFGDFSNIGERVNYYPPLDEIEVDNFEMGKISNLKGKNAATCVERATLSHILLKSLGINSTLKFAGFINNDGRNDAHAFNLVEDNNIYYIFDSTQPTLIDEKINPLVAEIPSEVSDELVKPFNAGYSVHVRHYNPLMDKMYDVTYDAGRDKYYDTCDVLKK